jgi:hypothetical protein
MSPSITSKTATQLQHVTLPSVALAHPSSSGSIIARMSYAIQPRIYRAGGKTTTDERVQSPPSIIASIFLPQKQWTAADMPRPCDGNTVVVDDLLHSWPQGCGGGSLRDASRCDTTINAYSNICEDHQFFRSDFRAIHDSKLWGYTWGNRGDVEKDGVDSQSPIQYPPSTTLHASVSLNSEPKHWSR